MVRAFILTLRHVTLSEIETENEPQIESRTSHREQNNLAHIHQHPSQYTSCEERKRGKEGKENCTLHARITQRIKNSTILSLSLFHALVGFYKYRQKGRCACVSCADFKLLVSLCLSVSVSLDRLNAWSQFRNTAIPYFHTVIHAFRFFYCLSYLSWPSTGCGARIRYRGFDRRGPLGLGPCCSAERVGRNWTGVFFMETEEGF